MRHKHGYRKLSRTSSHRKALLKNLSIELTKEFGKGFSVDNLENMRRFYLVYSKSETLSRKFELSWSHYIFLSRIKDEIDLKRLKMKTLQLG